MTVASMTPFIHLRQSILLRDESGLTDGKLLTRFIEQRDEFAFGALVRRHSAMVWGVCRRVLSGLHDAEDAFQATFLVLVRKAASVAPREVVGNWLYGVACTTAHRVKVALAKQRRRETQMTEFHEPVTSLPDRSTDLHAVLDQELCRLPDKYRAPIVLCDLEGKTRKEAARQLRCPEGTVAGRLARARAMLAKRMGRHGQAISGGALAVALSQNGVSASAPAAVVSSTIKTASVLAAGGSIPPAVGVLIEGVMKTMLITKLKIGAVVLMFAGVIGLSICGVFPLVQADEPPVPNVIPTKAAPEAAREAQDPAAKDSSNKGLADLEAKQLLKSRIIAQAETKLKELAKSDNDPDVRQKIAQIEEAMQELKKIQTQIRDDDEASRKAFKTATPAADANRAHPAPSRDQLPPRKPYVIAPGDPLMIEVYTQQLHLTPNPAALHPQPISGQHLVRPDGRVSLGIWGSVKVSGLSLKKAEDSIRKHVFETMQEEKREDGRSRVEVPEKLLVSVNVPTNEGTLLQIDVKVWEGDPLGTREAGTLKLLAEPRLVTQQDRPVRFFSGGQYPLLQDGHQIVLLDIGDGVEISPGKVKDGKVYVDVSVTTTSKKTTLPIQWESQQTRIGALAKLGEVVKSRLGTGSSTKQTWIEFSVQTVKP